MQLDHFCFDEMFYDYFNGRVKQIFWYITDKCQLRCIHCLYKPNLTFQIKQNEIDRNTIIELSHDFYLMGARKITVMGGEPTLYGDSSYEDLQFIIKEIKNIGYSYIDELVKSQKRLTN